MDNPLHEYPGYLLRRAATSRIADLARRLSPLQLTVTEATVLVLIARNPGLSQVNIGRIIAVKRANMNPIVRRLGERGLVASRQGKGRAHGLTLTVQGKEMASRIEAIFEEHEQWIVSSVPEELRPYLMPILAALWAPPSAPEDGAEGEVLSGA